MKIEAFRSWMEGLGTMSKNPISDAISRCKRIERCMNINLDMEYIRDRGCSLIEILTYTAMDASEHKPLPHGLDFQTGAKWITGMAALKAAVKKYFIFMEQEGMNDR